MSFYSVFGGSNLSRNLFVEHAGDDHGDDFALSWRERFEALPQRCNFPFSVASRAIPFQCNVNRIQQILVAERLGEELDSSGLQGPHGHRDVTVGTNKDDRDINLSLGQLALKSSPLTPGNLTSRTRKLALFADLRGKNSFADPKTSTSKPT